jgi:hypothetical protein
MQFVLDARHSLWSHVGLVFKLLLQWPSAYQLLDNHFDVDSATGVTSLPSSVSPADEGGQVQVQAAA